MVASSSDRPSPGAKASATGWQLKDTFRETPVTGTLRVGRLLRAHRSAKRWLIAVSALIPLMVCLIRPLRKTRGDRCGSRRLGVSPSPSFGPSPLLRLLRPLLTSRSGDLLDHRHPFRRKARSPQVRTSAFAAQPPDLRCLALVTRASRLHARLPCSAPPLIRFLFVGPQLRSPLPSRRPHGTTLCGSLRSL